MINTISERNKTMTKTALAKSWGLLDPALYYQPKRPAIDEEVKRQIEAVLTDNPTYGHKRIALALKLNKKRILRVMKKFGLKPYRRRVKKPRKKEDEGKPETQYQNLIKNIKLKGNGMKSGCLILHISNLKRNSFIWPPS